MDMNRLEILASQSKYKVIFDQNMPFSLAGLCADDTILINSNKSKPEQLQALSEEIAHQESSVGDLIAQDTLDKRQQEKKARRIAIRKLVTLDDLIAYKVLGIDSIHEAAELSDITVDFLFKALDSYREQFGDFFTYKGFLFDLTHGLNILQA